MDAKHSVQEEAKKCPATLELLQSAIGSAESKVTVERAQHQRLQELIGGELPGEFLEYCVFRETLLLEVGQREVFRGAEESGDMAELRREAERLREAVRQAEERVQTELKGKVLFKS